MSEIKTSSVFERILLAREEASKPEKAKEVEIARQFPVRTSENFLNTFLTLEKKAAAKQKFLLPLCIYAKELYMSMRKGELPDKSYYFDVPTSLHFNIELIEHLEVMGEAHGYSVKSIPKRMLEDIGQLKSNGIKPDLAIIHLDFRELKKDTADHVVRWVKERAEANKPTIIWGEVHLYTLMVEHALNKNTVYEAREWLYNLENPREQKSSFNAPTHVRFDLFENKKPKDNKTQYPNALGYSFDEDDDELW